MSELLNDEDAPDVEDFVAFWMSPVMRTAVEDDAEEDVVCIVTRISGADDPDCGTDDPVVQLDWLVEGAAACKSLSEQGHRRMMLLARTLDDVAMPDGSTANPEYVKTLIRPRREQYANDRIVRYIARYRIGFSYVTVA